MTLEATIQMAETCVPNKFFFQIAEVCELTELPKSVVRFWESEFKHLTPDRTPSGRRMYRRKDIILLFQIKHLLYEKKYTIEGAKAVLESQKKAQAKQEAFAETGVNPIEIVRQELLSIRKLLD